MTTNHSKVLYIWNKTNNFNDTLTYVSSQLSMNCIFCRYSEHDMRWQPRSLSVALNINRLFCRWTVLILWHQPLKRRKSNCLNSIGICRSILTQDVKCMHTCQVAPYSKRPLRQRVTHLTPLLSRESYMYNEVALIDGQINEIFSGYNGVTWNIFV